MSGKRREPDVRTASKPKRLAPSGNMRLTLQNRKLLGKHYASKYQTGGRHG